MPKNKDHLCYYTEFENLNAQVGKYLDEVQANVEHTAQVATVAVKIINKVPSRELDLLG